MPSFLGTKELGLKTEWRYAFVDPCQRIAGTPGALCIDVGGSVNPGVIDFRADPGQGNSCAEIVFRRRDLIYNHLLSDWIRRHEEGRMTSGTKWAPILITRFDPGWDTLVSCFLALRLIEKGEYPVYAEALVQYAYYVNQNRYRLDVTRPESIVAPHLGYLAIQNLKGPDGRLLSLEAQFLRGLELLDRILSHIQMERSEAKAGIIRRVEDFLPGSPGSTAWIKDPWFAEIRKLLEAEPARFQRDLSQATTLGSVLLPASDGGEPVSTSAFIAPEPMESMANKSWVRSAGHAFLICPSGNPRSSANASPGQDPIYPRVSLSLDPCFNVSGRKSSLRGLGYVLERMETECRKARNQGMDDRGSVPRYADGYCANDDPWMEGRECEFTAVDSPRSGTWIPYARIVEAATKQPFWEIPLRHAVVSLLWVDRDAKASGENRRPLESVRGMSRALDAYYHDSGESTGPETVGDHALPDGISVTSLMRHFPRGTCSPILIITIQADSRTTLDGLAAFHRQIIQQRGGKLPDYVFAKVAVGKNFADPSRPDHLLSQLANGDAGSVEKYGGASQRVLWNSHAVVILDDQGKSPDGGRDCELEGFIYQAFLSESLAEFSERNGKATSGDGRSSAVVDVESLFRDFLRFRARYYQLGPVCTERGISPFSQITSSLRLAERCSEVQSVLDRLMEERRSKARGWMRLFH